MSVALPPTLSSVLDRCPLPTPQIEIEPSFFGRVPEEVQNRTDLRSGPKFLLSVLDRLARLAGKPEIDTTDPQLAVECGVSVNTISNWLTKLALVGLIERIGRTCRRIIRLLFRFRSGPTTPRTGGSQLPQETGDTTPSSGVNSPKNHDELTQKPGSSSKNQKNKTPKGPSSSSSPKERDTPTTAKTGNPPLPSAPPPPARPPVIETRRREGEATDRADSARRARWDALPSAQRAAIEAKVRADHPWLATLRPSMLLAHCLVAMEAEHAAVEVLPTDAQLGSLVLLAHADDPIMRWAAREELARLGRDDVFSAPGARREPAVALP